MSDLLGNRPVLLNRVEQDLRIPDTAQTGALYQPVLQACEKYDNQMPAAVVADGCYASQYNVHPAKLCGTKQTVFTKPVGLTLTDIGVKQKTFDALRDFRADVEGNISELKRAFGVVKPPGKACTGSTLLSGRPHGATT